MEWTLRTYYQCQETFANNGYVYFDTLTYNEKELPRISNFIAANNNWSCFNYKDIRAFYEKFRQQLKLRNDRDIKYYITSEYGEIRHRPHYHIMLFIESSHTPIEISEAVSKAWYKGRTDGIPYKSKKYVLEHNTVKTINLDTIRYISKYVCKEQSFIEIIDKRWQQLERYYEKTKYNKIQIKKIKSQYYRLTSPFHRQSQHFGEYALNYFSAEYLIENNEMHYKTDNLKINAYCSLPTYFKRKLFTQQVIYNKKKIWRPTELGVKYKEYREQIIIEKLTDRLKDLNTIKKTNYTDSELKDLAHYIILQRGRLQGKDDYKAHHKEADFYNYNTDKDLIYIGKKCISKNFAGNDKAGYCSTEIEPIDIEELVYIDNEKERMIERLQNDRDDKSLVLLKEHLADLKKIFFQNS